MPIVTTVARVLKLGKLVKIKGIATIKARRFPNMVISRVILPVPFLRL